MIDPPILPPLTRRALWLFGAAGAAAFGAGVIFAPARAWAALLVAAFYFLTVSLGAAALVALLHLTGAGWAAVVKRVAEALAAWLPAGALVLLAVLLGAATLYPWASDPSLSKGGFLTLPFFAARMAAILLLWIAFAAALRRTSLRQDRDRDLALARRNVALSAAFAAVLFVSFGLAAVDWIMSLQPSWSSTIFGWYHLGGTLQAGVAAVTVAVVLLRRKGLLPRVGASHLHDLGKLLFAMSTLWAYLWFSQFLLVWYANIPEEGSWYLARWHGGWGFLFWLDLAAGFAAPFLLLLPRGAKRHEASLLRAGALVLAAHWLDVYLAVEPAVTPRHLGVGPIEAGTFLAVLALFAWVVERAARSAPLLPAGDPFLVESLHHHQ